MFIGKIDINRVDIIVKIYGGVEDIAIHRQFYSAGITDFRHLENSMQTHRGICTDAEYLTESIGVISDQFHALIELL